MKAETEKDTKLVCPSCNEVFDNIDTESLYECAECGNCFTRSNSADGYSHKCPICNKFSSKVSDFGCPYCNEELEDKEVYIYKGTAYVDTNELIEAIKINAEDLPKDLRQIEIQNQEELQKQREIAMQKETEQIQKQKQIKEFKTVDEVQQAFNDFLNAIQSPIIKLVEKEPSDYYQPYIKKDDKGNLRWYITFEVTWAIQDKYLSGDTPINNTKLFYSDINKFGMQYMGMIPELNNTGSIGWFCN